MRASLCIVLLVAAAVFAADEKKTEKRGVLGLGYGGYAAPLHGGVYGAHGLGLYNQGLYGHGLYGHGAYGGGLLGHGLYGHAAVAPPLLGHGYYGAAAPLHGYSSPWLGLGHGYLH